MVMADLHGMNLSHRERSVMVPPMPLPHIGLVLLVVLIWGLNFPVMKFGVAEIPPLFLCALRFTFAALPAVFFIRPPKARWTIVAAFGLVLSIGQFGFLFTAIKIGMPAGLASIVMQVQAFFTMAMAFALIGERPGRHQILGALVAFGGIALIAATRPGADGVLPIALTLAAAFGWAAANLIVKKAGRVDMLAFTVWGSLTAPIPLLILSLLLEGPAAIMGALSHASWASAGVVAYLAYPTTIAGYGIWNWLLSRHRAATVAPFSLLVPVVGMTSSALVFGERLDNLEISGAVLILAGLAFNVFGGRLVALIGPGWKSNGGRATNKV
jgi:O-acetylserine/cysteine efflux transporter